MTIGKFLWTALTVATMSSTVSAQTPINIGFTTLGDNAAIFVAIDQGFFAKHGIDARATVLRSGAIIVPGLIAGEIQIGTLTAPTFVQALDGGLEIQALTTLSVTQTGSQTSGLLVRDDSGITSAQDLAGLSMGGGSIGSMITVGTREWLRQNGVETNSIRMIESPMPQLGDVLRNGNIDFTVLPEPLLSRAISGGGLRVIAYPFGELPTDRPVMVAGVSRAWAEANPEVALGAQAALIEATAWAIAHPDETMDIIATFLEMDPAMVRDSGFPHLAAGIDVDAYSWWVEVMASQDMLRSEVNIADAVVQ
jgi:NitT/TauT family transport system substrate-binding protein